MCELHTYATTFRDDKKDKKLVGTIKNVKQRKSELPNMSSETGH